MAATPRRLTVEEIETERRWLEVVGALPSDRVRTLGMSRSTYAGQMIAALGLDWWQANSPLDSAPNPRGRRLNIDWGWYALGTKPDSYFARRLNCSVRAVRKAREARGIAPHTPKGKTPSVDWLALPLGRIPDGDVAKIARCAKVTVQRRRTALGIPPYNRFA